MKPLSGLNVLLVEDEFLIALDAEEMLRELGAVNVTVVSTFEDAEKTIAESRFDFALLDVNLNGRKSFPLAEMLARNNTPVVFGTGYNLMARQMEGFKPGGVCVSKPYSTSSLQKGLQTALQKSGQQPGAAPAG